MTFINENTKNLNPNTYKDMDKSFSYNKTHTYIQIKPFKNNTHSISHRENILRNLSSIQKQEISFIMSWNQKEIKFLARIPESILPYFQNLFYNNFPDSEIIHIRQANIKTPDHFIHYPTKSKILDKSDFIKDKYYIDPMSDIINIFSLIDENNQLDIYFDIFYNNEKSLISQIWKYTKKFINYMTYNDAWNQVIDNEIFFSIGFHIHKTQNNEIGKEISNTFSSFSEPQNIAITTDKKSRWITIWQVVNFFHIPHKNIFFNKLAYTPYKKLAHPTNLPMAYRENPEKITTLWITDYRDSSNTFWIKQNDKLRHIYIIWKTWSWKSTLMSQMIASDINMWNGIALIDPHWDLFDNILDHIPEHRKNDVVVFDISDKEHPIWFNLLESHNEEEKNLIVSWIISTFYKLFSHSRWPRLEYILRNTLLTLIQIKWSTFMDIPEILINNDFRKKIVSQISDPILIRFREEEFNKLDNRQKQEAISPIINKIWQFLSSSIIRNIFSQEKNKINFRQLMDQQKIILINLSKWKIWEDNASMIWSLLTTKIQIDSMSRADTDYESRKNFFLYIDEFQNFATKSFSTILSESRKYKLWLIMANQFINQLSKEVKDSIFWNVWSIISFQLWNEDAETLSQQFKSSITAQDIISLPKYTAYCKLMIDNNSSELFSMQTLSTSEKTQNNYRDSIIQNSREKYAIEKNTIEEKTNWKKKEIKIEKINTIVENKEESQIQQDWPQTLFDIYKINKQRCDAIIFDKTKLKHKAVRYNYPHWIDEECIFIKTKSWSKIYKHKTIKDPTGQNLIIILWNRIEIKQTLSSSPHFIFVDYENRHILEELEKQKKSDINIQIWKTYDAKVKLIYNYWLFVSTNWAEWLLHKSDIKTKYWTDRKNKFQIWSPIQVIAKWFKEIQWEKKVIWWA